MKQTISILREESDRHSLKMEYFIEETDNLLSSVNLRKVLETEELQRVKSILEESNAKLPSDEKQSQFTLPALDKKLSASLNYLKVKIYELLVENTGMKSQIEMKDIHLRTSEESLENQKKVELDYQQKLKELTKSQELADVQNVGSFETYLNVNLWIVLIIQLYLICLGRVYAEIQPICQDC